MVSAATPLHAPGSEPLIDDNNFAVRLVGARRSKGFTQQPLAGRSAHVTKICRYEAGSSQPTLDVLLALALAVNVSATSLLFDNSERGPKTPTLRSRSKQSTGSPPKNNSTSPPSSKAHSFTTSPAKP